MSRYYDVCNKCGKEFTTDKLSYEPKASTLIFGGRPFFEKRCDGCEKKVSKVIENVMEGLLHD